MANRFVDATLRLVDKFSSPLSKATAEMQAKGRQIQKTANSSTPKTSGIFMKK